MKDEKLNKGLKEFEDSETIEQSLALVEIVKDLLKSTKEQLHKTYILLILSLLSNLVIVGAFLWYESQYDFEEGKVVETSTTTQTVDGENSEINNVEGNQYKDNATHKDNRVERNKSKGGD